jgi:agmatinase
MLTRFGPRIMPFEFDTPWKTLVVQNETSADIGIVGIPFDGGTGGRIGTAEAPFYLRELARHKTLTTEDGTLLDKITLHDYGDVDLGRSWEQFYENTKHLATKALKHRFALFLGGDHSVTIPLTAAFDDAMQTPWGLIQIDAHPDLADIERGFKWSHACTARRALELPGLSSSKLAFVGLRSFMSEEIKWLHDHPETNRFTAKACFQTGMDKIADSIISQMAGLDAVYLTLDIDNLDPAFAPGTGTPQAGGLSTRDVLILLERLFTELPVRAMDIVEVAPPLDHSDITGFAAIKFIYESFGFQQLKWNR